MEHINTENPRKETAKFLTRIEDPYERPFNIGTIMSMASVTAALYVGDNILKVNESLEKLITELAAIQVQNHMQWIDVCETLPEEGADVWVVEKHKNQQTAAQYCNGIFGCGVYGLLPEEIVCWMYQVPFHRSHSPAEIKKET